MNYLIKTGDFSLVRNYLRPSVGPLCRNLGSRVYFLVKVILIHFQLEKYMQCKEKDVYNFFLAVLTSQ